MRKGLNKVLAVLIAASMAMSTMQTGMTVNAMEDDKIAVSQEDTRESEPEDTENKTEEESKTEESKQEESKTEESKEEESKAEESKQEESKVEESKEEESKAEESKQEESKVEESKEEESKAEESKEEESKTEESKQEESETETESETEETATEEKTSEEDVVDNKISPTAISVAVEGGNIYFEPSNGYIIEADDTVTDVDIPSEVNGYTVTGIDEAAFDNCVNLTSVDIPETVTFIGAGIFYNCSALSNVSLPSGITRISSNMFYGCNSLRSIDLPSGITEIGQRAFYQSGIESISFQDELKSIGEYAFYRTDITELILPESVESIGEYAFCCMDSLQSVELSSGMTEIANNAFCNNSALKSVVIPEGITKFGSYAFKWDYALSEIVLPESLESVDSGAFYCCNSLERVSFGGNLKSIGSSAFYKCTSLDDIEFPESLTFIGNQAFKDCPFLRKAYFKGDAPQLGDSWSSEPNVFQNCAGDFTIYYLADKEGWTTPEWNGYKTKIWNGEADEDIIRYEYKDETGEVIGFIFFDKLSGYVVAADENLVNAEIPNKIADVDVVGIKENAFRECRSLVSVTIPDTVIDIGSAAFYGCTSLSSITLPQELTKISSNMFYDCYNLTSIGLPSGITEIEENAFYYSGIKSITFPYGLESVGDYAFYCTNITELTLPGSVEKVGQSAFTYMSSLQSVKLSNKMTEIANNAFSNNNSLISIEIPEGITKIGSNAFAWNAALREIELPNSLETIESSAFYGCRSLESVSFGENLKTIGNNAFSQCTALKKIEFPESLTSIDSGAFSDCAFLRKAYFKGNAPELGYSWSSEKNVFKNCSDDFTIYYKEGKEGWTTPEWNGYQTKVWSEETQDIYEYSDEKGTVGGKLYFDKISGYVVSADAEIESVIIPDKIDGVTVVGIGDGAFKNCSNLKSVVISDTVNKIGTGVFYDCDSLSSVTLPRDLTRISSNMFYGCRQLKSVELPSGITEIGQSAFSSSGVERIAFPNGLISIGDYAFRDSNIIELTLPDSVEQVGQYAFSNISSLQSVELSGKMAEIAGYAFADNYNLKSIEIPEGITKIGSYAFAWNSSLNEIELPESLEMIDSSAFYDCSSLESVSFGEKLKSIGNNAFSNCTGLRNLTFSEGLETINGNAFTNCTQLKEVVFPESLKNINYNAFSECLFLRRVYFKGDAPSINYLSFYNCSEDLYLLYREGKEGWTSPEWNGYKTKTWDGKVTEDQKGYDVEGGKIYVSTINNYIIASDEGVTKAEIPAKIEDIDVLGISRTAFIDNTSVEYVEIPATVTKIDKGAFDGCSALTTIVNHSEEKITLPEFVGSDEFFWTDEASNKVEEIGKGTYERTKALQSITLNKTRVYTVVEREIKLTATCSPSDATNASEIVWESSNTAVATVDQGTVKAVGEGEVVITSGIGEIKAECKVTVYKDPVLVNSITLNKTSAELKPGATLQLSVSSYGPENVTDEPELKWSSSDTAVATVDDTGKVTAVSEGTAAISVQGGNATANCEVTVKADAEPEPEPKPEPEPDKITVKSIEDQQYTGLSVKPEIMINHGRTRLVQGADYTITYKNNVNVGKATVIIKYKGSYAGEQTVTFNIVKADLKNVIVEDIGLAHNGKAQKKVPVLSYNGKTLKQDKDYTVQFGEGNFTDIGQYKVTYTGIGNNFTGTTQGTVTILDRSKVLSKANVKLNKTTWYYTGDEIKPGVTVKMAKVELRPGDYDVTYYNNIEAGKATVVVKGKGEYAGTKKVNFVIKRQAVELTDDMVTVDKSMQICKGGCTPEPVVKCDGSILIKNVDYTVSYQKNKSVGTATVTIKGKGNYKGTVKKNFAITVKDLSSVHMRVEDIVYTGKAGKYVSKPVLMDDDSTALTSADYGEITYTAGGKTLGKKDNPELGTEITVTVTGKGNYTGKVSATYTLREGKKFSRAKITVTAKSYTGKQVEITKDDISVTYDGATLTYGKDYEIVAYSYKNNIKKGTATVAIKGCGDYVGEKTAKFTIKSMESK